MADVKGNFGYLCRGRIPIRSMDNSWLPAPGWTGEHEWQGYIPFEEMPRSLDPESGYVATANNRPVGDDYPYYIALDFTPGFRAERVTRRLLSLDRPSAADMVEVHREMVSAPARAYLAFLQDVTPESPEAARAKAKPAWLGLPDGRGSGGAHNLQRVPRRPVERRAGGVSWPRTGPGVVETRGQGPGPLLGAAQGQADCADRQRRPPDARPR